MDDNNDISDVFMGIPGSQSSQMELDQSGAEVTDESMNEELTKVEQGRSALLSDTLDDNPNSPFLDQLSPEDYFPEFDNITRFSFDMGVDTTQKSASSCEITSEPKEASSEANEATEDKVVIEDPGFDSQEMEDYKTSLSCGEIIYLALLNSPHNEVSVEEIHKFMMFYFEGDLNDWSHSIDEFLENKDYFKSYEVEVSSQNGIYYTFANKNAKEMLKESINKTIEKHGLENLGLRNNDLLISLLDGSAGFPNTEENTETIETQDLYKKSCLTYPQMIFLAIVNSPDQQVLTSEVYQFLTYHFPHFSQIGTFWYNNVRSNLSRKKVFKAIQTGAPHYLYSVNNEKTFDKLKESIEKTVENKGVEALQLRNKDSYRDLIDGTAGFPHFG